MTEPELPSANPKPPEHINNRYEHPFKDLLVLVVGVVGILVLATLLLSWTASTLAPLLPYEWEVSLLQSDSETQNLTQPQASSQIQSQNHDAIATELAAVLQRITGPDALPIRLHYLPDQDMPNAFATLGGHIFVTRGLLESIESENGLAMVLAHEYAHVELRHPITLMMEQLSIGFVLTMIGSDNVAQLIAQNTAAATALSFSREMERAADRYALEALQRHYGHTVGADEFFLTVQEQHQPFESDSRWQQMLQTHPLTSERIEVIRSGARMGELTPLPEALRITLSTPDKTSDIQ